LQSLLQKECYSSSIRRKGGWGDRTAGKAGDRPLEGARRRKPYSGALTKSKKEEPEELRGINGRDLKAQPGRLRLWGKEGGSGLCWGPREVVGGGDWKKRRDIDYDRQIRRTSSRRKLGQVFSKKDLGKAKPTRDLASD